MEKQVKGCAKLSTTRVVSQMHWYKLKGDDREGGTLR
jgi:hypothetical protein